MCNVHTGMESVKWSFFIEPGLDGSGKNQKGMGISFDSSVSFDQVRNLIPIPKSREVNECKFLPNLCCVICKFYT